MTKIRFIAAVMAVLMTATVFVQAAEPAAAADRSVEEQEHVVVEDAVGEVLEEVPNSADWNLLLVNPWNSLPQKYAIEKRKLANGLLVDARIYDDLNAMLIDCWAAGLHPVVCSAYRTNVTQQRLYNNKVARLRAAGYGWTSARKEAARWVAPPGTSEHQTGMALDIVSYQYQLLNKQQENTPEQKWLMEHCWDYGFVLRYPENKTEITGIGYEPWHYRYVGRAAAKAMKESGVCLEEYLEVLKTAEQEAALTEELPAAQPVQVVPAPVPAVKK